MAELPNHEEVLTLALHLRQQYSDMGAYAPALRRIVVARGWRVRLLTPTEQIQAAAAHPLLLEPLVAALDCRGEPVYLGASVLAAWEAAPDG